MESGPALILGVLRIGLRVSHNLLPGGNHFFLSGNQKFLLYVFIFINKFHIFINAKSMQEKALLFVNICSKSIFDTKCQKQKICFPPPPVHLDSN